MKEKGAMPSKIIGRNWVLKCKRKKLLCGTDVSVIKENDPPAESASNPASSKGMQKTAMKHATCSSKKKGNDGYYYECVICDVGGNLLCCDSCPRTYHLECLDPPLEHIPNGKWQCPGCFQKQNSPMPIGHQDIPTKRARTKVLIGKLKAERKSSDDIKVSQFLGGSFLGKKGASTKRKSTSGRELAEKKPDSSQIYVSCHSKSRKLSHGGSVHGALSCANGEGERKHDITPLKVERTSDSATKDKPAERSNSSVEDLLSLSRATDLVPDDGSFEIKPGLPSKNKFSRRNLIPALDASQSCKRKLKACETKSKKKSRSVDGKFCVNSFQKGKSKTRSACFKTCNAQRKGGSVDHVASTSREDVGSKRVDNQQKEEKLSQEEPALSNELGGVRADRLVPSEDLFPEEAPQVDRVLGCRMQCQTYSSDQISEMVAIALPSGDEQILDNITRVEETGCDIVDNEDAQNHSEDPNLEKHSNVDKCTLNDAVVDKIQVYRRYSNKECKKGKMNDTVRRDTKGSSTAAINAQDQDNSSSLIEDKPVLQSAGAKTQKERSAGDNSSSHNKIQESTLSESAFFGGEKISYEFLVKWVGKSHIHNSWIPETMLKAIAKRKLDNYKSKYGTASINLCEEQWMQPQRVIALRLSNDGTTEAFVKWLRLPYDECTWESTNEPIIKKSLHLIDMYNKFERDTLQKDTDKENSPKSGDRQQTEIFTLVEQPKELKGGSLFPHQLEALNWLRKCWHRSKNVILADEMGLGKTVSACAFMSSLYFEFKVKLPCLVLVPLSTMPNWMAEFSSWAPDLNVVEYHGCAKARNLIRQYEWHASHPDESNKKTVSYKFNVLLTTYEMVLADSSHLRGIPWEVLVVDEGHRLKNSSSKLFSLLNTFSFQHRVLLTGTPLQNNIGELYNLLNFLQPASFPSLASFEKKFRDLTTAEKLEELKKLVSPHMLRRLKKDAMQNIPPKTERMVPVELSSIQAEYYRAMLTKNYQILRNIGKGVPQQSMLNIVMQLRKVCNHPYLIPGTEPDYGSVKFLQEMRIKASAKLTLLHSMLKALHKEGHRVLIFSQMTKLLDILEDYLTVEFGPKSFERVDGSVSVADRQAAISRYNQDKSRFIFLLSTRSCGLGINLATADTVIIYDSDFNPHADIQAMNRAHRIGQSNRLLVYRLVVRASVEERILQLAKKKLMLDQLFVNKSGSQKEVEDILRWGTEELFSDSYRKDIVENDLSKVEAVADAEQKTKRRTGGLGDVYKDKCTEGSNKIIWDDNAIMTLLDRSNLKSGTSDNLEGDLENDMLGSLKSVEWNDEPVEEDGRTESPLAVTDDAFAANCEKKLNNLVSGTEENEWDRLLRVRWEKYQDEEAAALGRGKRLRKVVSYREAFASHPNETLSESGGDDDREPEPDPQKEYTPAGRALKLKFAMLRARQKERLARQKAHRRSFPVEGLSRPDSLFEFPSSNVKENDETAISVDPSEDRTVGIDQEGNKYNLMEVPKSKNDSTKRVGRLLKHKFDSHQNSPAKLSFHVSSENLLPVHSFQGPSSTNIVPPSCFLPVLGLCAPNASQSESSHRNFSRSNGSDCRQGSRSGIPFPHSPCPETSAERNVEAPEAASDKLKLPATSSEVALQNVRHSIAENALPFPLCPPAFLQGKGMESSGTTSNDFLEQMGFPDLPFDEKLLPRFDNNFQNPPPDFFPSLSLERTDANANGPIKMPSTVPLLPNLKFPLQHVPNYSQHEIQMPPTLSLGQVPSACSFPESHRKVLENIIMRTGSRASNLFKRKSKADDWSEEELDSLWIGVRRYGRGKWDAMLRDPRLKFSKYKSENELATRWEEEQHKILDAPPMTKASKPGKFNKHALFPIISDGMMTLAALHGRRLGGPLKFRSHLTDVKLGFGDLSTNLHHFEQSNQAGFLNENNTPFPTCVTENFRPIFLGENSMAPSEPGTSSNTYMDLPYMPNACGPSYIHPLNVNCSGSFDLQQNDDELDMSRRRKFPCLLDRPLDILSDSLNDAGSHQPSAPSLLPNLNAGPNFYRSKGKEEALEKSSYKDNLPHWLREAVNAPVSPHDPELPPSVSAIAESVRLLYAEEKPTIPPFLVPSPPPSRPKDPRKKLKKWRRRMPGDITSEAVGTSYDNLACGSIPTASSPFSMPPLPTSGTLRIPSVETHIQISKVNTMNPSSSSALEYRPRKMSAGLTPSSQTDIDRKLLSSYSSYQEGRAVVQQDLHHESHDLQSKHRLEQYDNGDSDKTPSGASPADKPEVEEMSEEETVSDDHTAGDHEL
ncbi:hypothetical protein Nepgr_029596 [Nepenthes gracilis]|uniref:Protein CHROMATIN REMODELING 4 n=1 Tax=Nepenthes gracilis TaxID=150966 RepID=A0AAD3TCR4_NEPGR|nr:hypothetical protein Nepgr_029596 [Nepenthes gracilis]